MTLAEYAPEWLSSLQVKDSTKAMYDSLVRNQLGELNDYRITRIGAQDIRRLLLERQREGYAGRTRRGILDVLRMILRMAQNDGIVDRNVAELVDPPRIDAKDPVHFTAEQARRFLDAASRDALHSLYAVALATGLRRGELLALTWRDVALDTGLLHVRRSKTNAGVRTIPIAGFAAAALRGLPMRPGRIWPYDPSYVTRHVGVICQRAGLPRLTFHGLRHSAASILLAEGVDPTTIRSILGHTRVSMTEHYARPEDEAKREAVERLGRAIG